jgi:transposase
LKSTPESGQRAGYDGAKRRKGSKAHMAVDTLGYLLAAVVTPANAQYRAQVAALAEEVQAVTGQAVTLAYADQGYTGQEPAQAAAQHGIDLHVVKLPQAKKASRCYPSVGLWNTPLPGRLVFGALPETTNDSPQPPKACITSYLTASCSSKPIKATS